MALKNPGKLFEEQFKKSIKKRNYYYVRLKDNPTSFIPCEEARFTPKNPYDCIMWANGTMFCFELKSTKAFNLDFWSEKLEVTNAYLGEKAMIKKNQVNGLKEAGEHDGIVAGFIINFRETTNHTYFWSIQNFLKFTSKSVKKSFNEKDVIENSGICIPQTLLKVSYDYAIDNLVDMFTGSVKHYIDKGEITHD